MGNTRPVRGRKAKSSARHSGVSVVPLDAEDIALARLQAQLRKTEAIRSPARQEAAQTTRTTVRLPTALLRHVRARAQRDELTVSEIVRLALERYLKLP